MATLRRAGALARTRAAALVIALTVGASLVLGATAAYAQDGQELYTGKVIAKTGLNVRDLPSTAGEVLGTLPPGRVFDSFICKVEGTSVDGNPRWYALPPTLNEWVSARYIENIGNAPRTCGDGTTYRGEVIARPSLSMRTGPTTAASRVGSLSDGTNLNIVCKLEGQTIDGNPRWYHLANGRWVAARYVDNVGAAPVWCN